jgi:ligand-binding sensor domain-containing protein/signal transduction histidine kinase
MIGDVLKKAFRRLNCWLAAFLALGVGVASGGNPSDQFQFEAWKVDRGLPQNTVLSLLQTRDGYLWIGTRFGLARFDGMRFTVFDSGNTPELQSENCEVLAEDSDGNLWVGTGSGLLRRSRNRFQLFTTTNGLCHDRIRSLSPSRDGGMWIGTEQGFCRFKDGTFSPSPETTEPITNRIQIHETTSGDVWFNTAGGLHRLRPSTGELELMMRDSERPRFFQELPDGSLSFGHERGLFQFDGTNVQRVRIGSTTRSGDNSAAVHAAFQSRAGDLWITPSQPRVLHLLQQGRLVPFVSPDGNPLDGVETITEDREGNIWLGTRYDGLVRLQRRFISMVTTRHGLGGENTWTVCEDAAGTIWAGTRDLSLNRIRGEEVTPYFISKEHVDIVSILPDGLETLWVGVKKLHPGSSLYQFRDGRFTDFNMQSGIYTRSVSALWKDRSGYLWIGTPEGLTRWREGESSRFTTKNGLPHNDVRAILEDKQGDLWFGTYGGGICRLRNGQFTTFDMNDGLCSNFAWELHEDTEGVLWIGTRVGLNRFKDGRFFTFTTQHGLFDNLANCVLEDDRGFFWISCNRGIYRVSRAELNEVADGKKKMVKHFSYGTADGMASSETNGENQPAGCKSRDGRLWFPTIQGLAIINPNLVPTNEVTPPVVIEQVVADNELLYSNGLETRSVSLEPHADLAPGRARVVRIQFTANSLAAPEKVQFKYRLRGYEEDWRGPGKERVAYYTNLRPGNYHFEVMACNNHGVWNLSPAFFTFTLAPHFYQRISFYVFCALVALTTGIGAHKFRIRIFGRLKELEKFRAIELERARIAKDMHDDLGSSLTQISLMTELATRDARDHDEFRSQVQHIGQTTRGVLQSLDEIVWATNPRNDTLEGLVSFLGKYAREFLGHTKVACRLDIPPMLPSVPVSAEVRHNLFLVVKEGLTNVVKHSGATEVWLRTNWAAPMLELGIEDNGSGVSACAGDAHSDGVRNMEQRLRTMKGSFSMEPRQEGGTRLRLRVPLFGGKMAI